MIIILILNSVIGYKDLRKTISHLNLLLPQIINPDLFYKINAHNGCYRWKSSHPQILELNEIKEDIDIEEECFSSVEVRVKNKTFYEGIIWITAVDRDTREMWKCESKISPISKLFISTKMKTFDVGNFEEIELLGYDKDNNSFNTLEGLKFNWIIEQEDKFAEITPFNDSLIKTSEIRKQIEFSKFQSDKIVLKGIKTGRIKLKVKLNENNPIKVESEDYINFIEKFIILSDIITDEVNLPLCSKLNFNLYNIKTENLKNKIKKANLPNQKYNWIADKTIGNVNDNGLFNTLNKESIGYLEVVDKSSPIKNSVKKNIKVNGVFNIELYIKEYNSEDIIFDENNIFDNYLRGINNISNFNNNWNLIINKEYIVRIFIFDKNNDKLIFPKNFKLDWKLDDSVEIISKGLDYLVIKPKLLKINLIEVTLNKLIENKILCHNELKFKKSWNILSKVKIIKPVKNIILPYISGNKQILKLIGIGGDSSHYEWLSEDNKIVSINSNTGVAKALSLGKTKIILRDRKNFLNNDYVMITVEEIGHGQFLEEDIEMLSYKKDSTYYKLFNNKKEIFLNCTSLIYNFENNNTNFDINFSNETYDNWINNLHLNMGLYNLDDTYINSFEDYEFYLNNNVITKEILNNYIKQYKNYGICNKIDLNSKNQGDFNFKNNYTKDKNSKLNVRVYNDLVKLSPNFDNNLYSNILNISPGSSLNIKLEGGPSKWQNRINRDLENQINKNTLLKYDFEIISQDNFTIICKDNLKKYDNNIDEIKITYKNQKDNKLLRPIEIEFSIKIICNIPKKLKIINIYDTNIDYLENNILNNEIILKNQKEHLFKIICLNNDNKLFFNNTSLYLDWKVNTDNDKVKLSDSDKGNWYKNLNWGLYTGDFKLEVISNKLISSNSLEFSISDSISIKSMKNLFLEPNSAILYNSNKITHKIKIFNGSGNFNIKVDNPDLILLKYDKLENPREIFITPRKLGDIKIIVEDNELKFSQIIESKIKIVDNVNFKLDISKDFVEKGKEFNATIKLLYKNQEINNEQLNSIPFVIFDSNNHNIVLSKIKYNNYEIYSKHIGNLNLGIKIEDTEKNNYRIKDSDLVEIEIFNPIRVIPGSLILSPGCKTSFKYIEGPSDNIINKHKLKVTYNSSKWGNLSKENNIFYFESHTIGEESIEFKIINSKDEIISSYLLKVKININLDIDIYNNFNINIYQFSKIKLIFYPTINKEQLNKSICNFSVYYKYRKDSSIEILNEKSDSDDKSLEFNNFCEDNNYYSCSLNNKYLHFYLNSIKINSVKIDLLFLFKFGENYNSITINKVLNINILERLKVKYPLFVNHKLLDSHEILLPTKSIYLLEFNKIKNLLKIKPNINSEKLLEIKNNFVVKTKEILGYGHLEIENIDIPNEKMLIPINIVNIYYIIVKNVNYQEIRIPQNFKIKLDVILLDNFGRIISTPLVNFKINSYSLNPNVANCNFNSENFTWEIQGKNEGKTIVTIELNDNSKIFDVIEINVGPVLENKLPINIHVGSNIQFNLVNHKIENKDKKLWASNNNEILEINPYNGLGKAKTFGNLIVKYDNIINYKINVNIYKINEIKIINKSLKNILTNIDESEHFKEIYKFKLRFFDNNKEINDLFVNKDLITSNLELECKCVNTLLNCYPKHFVKNNYSESYCYIEFINKYNKNLKLDFTDLIDLKVVLMTYDISYRLEQNFKFKTQWSFKLQYNKRKIELNQNKNKIEIISLTPNDLSINSNYLNSYIKKNYIKKDNYYIITLEIPKKLKNTFNDIISIHNLSTKQIKKLEFSYDYDKSLINSFKVNLMVNSLSFEDYVTLVLIIGCIIFGYYYFIKKEDNRGFVKKEESYFSNNNNSFNDYNNDYNYTNKILENSHNRFN